MCVTHKPYNNKIVNISDRPVELYGFTRDNINKYVFLSANKESKF